jgi:broad specificity phosphatase PhoE
MISRFALLLALLLAPFAFGAEPTTVVLVRHAEAAAAGGDAGLSEAGTARAEALAAALKDANVKAVYVSQYQRTKATAAPAARQAKVTPTEVALVKEGMDAQLTALAKQIVTDHPGQTVLVVGHSNTIPVMAEALSGVKAEPIAHEEYDRFYVVVLESGKPARLIVTRYGPKP